MSRCGAKTSASGGVATTFEAGGAKEKERGTLTRKKKMKDGVIGKRTRTAGGKHELKSSVQEAGKRPKKETRCKRVDGEDEAGTLMDCAKNRFPGLDWKYSVETTVSGGTRNREKMMRSVVVVSYRLRGGAKENGWMRDCRSKIGGDFVYEALNSI